MGMPLWRVDKGRVIPPGPLKAGARGYYPWEKILKFFFAVYEF
jgi:hypothetical protein